MGALSSPGPSYELLPPTFTTMGWLVKIEGSNARDYPMFERNLLTHLRFAMILSMLAGSILLHARLPSPDSSSPTNGSTEKWKGDIPLASILVGSSVTAIVVGMWEYYRGCQDIRDNRAFLVTSKPHMLVMAALALVVFATCLALLIHE
ncbi:hypothetical protein C8Q75DRAFT_805222 [Abortiporus biennis]|nr:hypothetical protein C8Q75DRAFT_805222 [Abortiporus biennis]